MPGAVAPVIGGRSAVSLYNEGEAQRLAREKAAAELRAEELRQTGERDAQWRAMQGFNTGMDALKGLATGGAGGAGGGAGTGAAPSPGGGFAVNAGGAGTAPAILSEPDLTAADTAARTTAKEGAARRLQSSMRALDTEMSGRGIRGSGIQAEEMANLLGQSASDESMSELDRLTQAGERKLAVGARNQDATNSWATEQLRATQWAQERADKLANEQRQLALTLAQFGMRY